TQTRTLSTSWGRCSVLGNPPNTLCLLLASPPSRSRSHCNSRQRVHIHLLSFGKDRPGSGTPCTSRALDSAWLPGGIDVAKFCCFQYSHKILPWRWVNTYEFTRNSCSQQAVIFTTKKGHKVCAKPQETWVQKYISLLKAQKQL
uniref:C-C motif chemokine n=1 Tax=Sus scrofa TaxID=9823 RepID=A0A8D0ZU38_PIG